MLPEPATADIDNENTVLKPLTLSKSAELFAVQDLAMPGASARAASRSSTPTGSRAATTRTDGSS